MARREWADSDIDDLLWRLDAYASGVDIYEYGLPLYDEGQRAKMRDVFREWLAALKKGRA